MKIGRSVKGPDNNQETSYVGRVAALYVDEDAHELYAADGYGNRRVIVFDSDSGAFKRGWGAYGIPLSQIDNTAQSPYNPANPPSNHFLGPVSALRISIHGRVD